MMKTGFKTVSSVLIISMLLLIPLGAVAAQAVFPEVIPLPNGFQPEGIALGNGHTFFSGSLNGGAIFRGDLRSGDVEMIASPGVRMAVGMKFDRRSGLLFVAGGAFGTAYVFDGMTGEMEATYQLTPNASFVNDVIVTRQAAYFTDSFQKQIYRLPLGAGGELPAPADVQTIALGDGFDFTPGAFNANGIEASPDGTTLILVNSGAGKLYKVDPTSGEATPIDLMGGSVSSGDGLVLQGRTLFVVQNVLNQVAVVQLKPGFGQGKILGLLTSPFFRVPTTAFVFGRAVYAVNARFDEIPPGQPAPDDTFEVVRVPIRK
jgi:sugar lactone lactonase YvrE